MRTLAVGGLQIADEDGWPAGETSSTEAESAAASGAASRADHLVELLRKQLWTARERLSTARETWKETARESLSPYVESLSTARETARESLSPYVESLSTARETARESLSPYVAVLSERLSERRPLFENGSLTDELRNLLSRSDVRCLAATTMAGYYYRSSDASWSADPDAGDLCLRRFFGSAPCAYAM